MLCAAFVFVTAALAPAAAAAAPAELWRIPEAGPGSGAGAGQLNGPIGIAADSDTGHVFVSDFNNSRVDEFTAWGVFVKAFGWKVDAGGPQEALQSCTEASGCVAGSEGEGGGQFRGPTGIAVDSNHDVYVVDLGNHRVQKFDSAGNFLLMFGGDVNRTKVEALAPEAEQNRCPVDPGDVCQAGTTGSGSGQFAPWGFGDLIAVGPTNTVYVGDVERIQEFNADGSFKGAISGGELSGRTVRALAVDGTGIPYAILSGKAAVVKLGTAGQALPPAFPVESPSMTLDVGTTGNVYVVSDPPVFGVPELEPRVLEFTAAGEKLIPSPAEEAENQGKLPSQKRFFGQLLGFGDFSINGLAVSDACEVPGESLYLSYTAFPNSLLRAYGSPPDPAACPPPQRPPSIEDQYASAVDADTATVKARINSHLWPDTTYYVQYGTAPCSEGGCASEPAPPGNELGSKTNLGVTTTGIVLSDLASETTYHYRFVAVTNFGPGEEAEVRGVGGVPGLDGEEATFTTPPAPLPLKADCPNQAFRTGTAASLADCRAYEMVSPVDKEGGDIIALNNFTGFRAGLSRSATSGDRLTYSAYRAFGDPGSAPYTSQYMSVRDPDLGWETDPISPPRGRSNGVEPGQSTDGEFKAFSADLCQGWLRLDFEPEPTLDPDAAVGFPNLYRADLCGGSYEALTTVPPPHQEAGEYFIIELQGASADGSVSIFTAPDNLTPEAPPINTPSTRIPQLYVSAGGELRSVCILPGGTGTASEQRCSAGNSPNSNGQARKNTLTHAISEDGSRIFFTTGGKIYLRENPFGAGDECTEPGSPCTVPISPGAAQFWMVAADGSRAIFSEGGDLYEYDVTAGAQTLIGEDATGVMGASDAADRVYFSSKKALASGADEGSQNLYLYETGVPLRFIGPLSESDLANPKLAAITPEPVRRSSRVSPDGMHAVFMSYSGPLAEQVAGYDNTDQASGQADAEVYLYDAVANEGAGALFCVSCNPSGSRPAGRNIGGGVIQAWAAARIPIFESQLYGSRVLSEDGQRLFFNSFEALVQRDTNGKEDVYEWQEAASREACEAVGGERYVAAAGGCLSLISSGESSQDSEFLDASPSGRDVFFATGASLLPQDPELIDVYDARQEGGFPTSVSTEVECEGQACQNPPPPPAGTTPSSSTYEGPGDLEEKAGSKKPRCRKGKVRRGGRCVAKHGKPKHGKQKKAHRRRGSAGR